MNEASFSYSNIEKKMFFFYLHKVVMSMNYKNLKTKMKNEKQNLCIELNGVKALARLWWW